MKAGILIAATALLLPPLAADAQSYRCTTKEGRKLYGSTIPRQCVGLPVEELNRQGRVVRRIDPQGDEKERLAKEAAEAASREQRAAQQEAARRNNALLATYTSPKDIDDARARALANHEKAIHAIEARIAQLKKSLEANKAKGNAQAAEMDLKYQEQLLAVKQKEAEQISARYDEDRKRFTELTGKR